MKVKLRINLLWLLIIISNTAWAINVPTLYSPSNNSTSINTSISLICNIVNSITDYNNYTFELDTTPNFNSPAYVTAQGDYYNYAYIYKHNSGLLYDTTYYWRVKVTDGTNTSQWSDTWSFTTIYKLDLYSPSNNSTDITTTNTLYCNAENNNTAYANYDFELDTIPSFNSPLHQITNGNYYNYGHIYNPNSNLLYGTTYYWRVRVRNANDTSQWSDTWSFTTMAKLDLYSPANNSTDISINPSLRCNAESSNTAYANYDFEIDTIPSFNSPLHQMTNGNNYNYGHIYNDISNLLYGTTYYWRVRVKNTNDTSQWSDTWRFTTDYEMTNAPDLVSPVNNSTDIPYSSFSIEWNSISNANAYQYQISTTNDFSNIVKSGNASLTNKTITNLQAYTLYYWRVRGENNNGYSPWSNVWNFTTDQNSNIDDATNQSAIKLYPNPANDIISISGFEHISNVEIYNVIGKQMKIVSINGVKKTINIKELEKGIYFVKFISDKSLITEILIKK